MPINFLPKYTISPKTAQALMRIEAVKQAITDLPITSSVLVSLRETSRLVSTHYSTMIEGNRLTQEQVEEVIRNDKHFSGRKRDEEEVKGYYVALEEVERLATKNAVITERIIQKLHALVMEKGRKKVTASPYRDGQNVIRDSRSGAIVYMPPEAKDVPTLMGALTQWIGKSGELPCPIVAGIAHYQFATIHPYYDGNGRTARLLTTLILHLGGYGLKGIYSLEDYYACDLSSYYEAISIGPSHNYYIGRAESDITQWVNYFCEGMAESCEKVLIQAKKAEKLGSADHSALLRTLDPKQRKALELFQKHETITAKQIGDFFGFKPRTSNNLCKKWVESGFLMIVDPSRKARRYQLIERYQDLVIEV